MGKIGDLWVRLGLKKQDFDKGLKDAEKQTQAFNGALKAIGAAGKAAFAAVSIAVISVVSVIKDLAKQNQTLGDAFGRTAAGMAAMWDTFKGAIATTDFTHIISDLGEANRLARELYNTADALGEIRTSYSISLARQLKTINELRVKLRDVGATEEERLEAGAKLLQIYEDLEKNPTRGMNAFSDANLDVMAQKLGFKIKHASESTLKDVRKKVEDFFVWLGSEEGQKYNEAAQKALQNGGKNGRLAQNYLYNAAYQGRGDYAQMTLNYNANVNDKKRIALEEAVVSAYQQEAKYSEETLRIQNQINSVKAKQAKSAGPQSVDNTGLKQSEREMQRLLESIRDDYREIEQYDENLEQLGVDTAAAAAATLGVTSSGFSKAERLKAELFDLADSAAAGAEQMNNALENGVKRAEELAEEFVSVVVGGFSSGAQELTDQLLGLEEINPGRIFQALLSPLADMAVKEGEIIMAGGFGIEAIKDALGTLEGVPAVVAGAALISIGAAAKSGLAALAKGGSGTTVQNYSGAGASGTGEVIRSELVVRVEGTLKGSDIVLSGTNTEKSWNR